MAGQRSSGPTGRQGPSGRSPAVGTYEGWVTSYGVCGHLLDSLSACDHSATLMKPEQARFGRLYVRISFFGRLRLRQKEGVKRGSANQDATGSGPLWCALRSSVWRSPSSPAVSLVAWGLGRRQRETLVTNPKRGRGMWGL